MNSSKPTVNISESLPSHHEGSVSDDEMDWDAYAEHYDKMCDLNPAYQLNIDILLKRLSSWNLPADAAICDLGAGTGNYILKLSEVMRDARFWHVDFDSRMIEVARRKYDEARIDVNIVESNVHSLDFASESFDLIVCINALYAFSSQFEMLERMRRWLKPSGRLFLIDFGRRQNTLDWTLYMLREAFRSNRLGQYTRTLVEGRELLKQNRRTTKGQGTGRYWLHSTKEFGQALQDVGFNIDELGRCYREYADYAICTR